MELTNFTVIKSLAMGKPPLRLAVAGGDDPAVIGAVLRALEGGLIASATISGKPSEMRLHIPVDFQDQLTLLEAATAQECASQAVAEVREDRADILMKGDVDTQSLLRAVVNRDTGIRGEGVLSNVTVAALPSYGKLLVATDNGIVPMPDLKQKRQIILNTRPMFDGLGITPVKVAAIAATEKVSEALPATLEAQQLSAESRDGKLPGFIVDGPFGYDVAVLARAAEKKSLSKSPVAGRADLILFPNIDAANSVAKSWKLHGQADTGSIVLGARVPILLNSRSDGIDRRLNALCLAIITSGQSSGNRVGR